MSRTPRSHLALDHAHRSGGAASQPLVAIAAIGDYLAEGAIAVNARRVITYANRTASALLGIRTESLVGRDILTTASAGNSPLFVRALTDVLERGSEQLLTVSDTDANPPFNVDYCRLLPIADGGALILLGELLSPDNIGRTRASAALIGDLEKRAERFSAVAKVQLAMSRTEVRDVYAEAKANGYDTKTMRTIVRLRKMEKHARDEADALLTFETERALVAKAAATLAMEPRIASPAEAEA